VAKPHVILDNLLRDKKIEEYDRGHAKREAMKDDRAVGNIMDPDTRFRRSPTLKGT